MMKQYVIRCLSGTSSVELDIEVMATSFTLALRRCRDNGLMPVQNCMVHSSATVYSSTAA